MAMVARPNLAKVPAKPRTSSNRVEVYPCPAITTGKGARCPTCFCSFGTARMKGTTEFCVRAAPELKSISKAWSAGSPGFWVSMKLGEMKVPETT